MKNFLYSLILLGGLLSIASCSTDFDMYADYKDVSVVYGLTDISDDTTWIKITKAYTGPGNALLLAQNPDSSNYPYKLGVSLDGRKNGNDLTPIIFDTITIHYKAKTDSILGEDGQVIIINPFYSPNQLMYYAVGSLDKDAKYTLTINKKDEVLTASSDIVDDFDITSPRNRISFIENRDDDIEWMSTKNGKRYEVSIRFKYSEFAPGYADTLKESIGYFLGVVSSKNVDGGEELKKTYNGSNFYSILESELEPIPNVERWADSVYITIACGSQELATYLDINSGGATLLEEVPKYSNVEGGSGIFASRHTILKPVRLSSTTEATLVKDYNLGFKYKTK